MAQFDRDQLQVQMTETLKMAQFQITECSQMDAKAYVHEKANPFLARMLSNGIKRELINLRPGQEGQADADAIADTHFLVQYRKAYGFLVLVPDMIYQGFVRAPPVITFRSDHPIKYTVRFTIYNGPDIMKAQNSEFRCIAIGKVSPAAMQHVTTINNESVLKQAFINMLSNGGLNYVEVKPHLDSAGNKRLDSWHIEFETPKINFTSDSYGQNEEALWKLHKAYSLTLPSGDDATLSFTAEFCKRYNLHMFCGKPNDRMTGRCPHCRDSSKGKKALGKRNFNDMADSLNGGL